MKGLELPINMIVVVAIAVLVLVVVAAFFTGRLIGGGGDIDAQAALSRGCQTLRTAYNCVTTDVHNVKVLDYARPGQTAPPGEVSLFVVCQRNSYLDEVACAKACGCPGT